MIALDTNPAAQTASSTRTEQLVAPLVLAFANDPAARWLYPNPDRYRTHFAAFVRAFAGKAFSLGTAYGIGDGHGTALWLPPGVQPDDEAIAKVIKQSVEATRLEAVFALFEEMGAKHPAEAHWYLPLIGIDPCQQRRGLGSALLSRTLTLCDEQQLPAYLEATSPANVALYERHGFELCHIIRAAGSLQLFGMLRQPR